MLSRPTMKDVAARAGVSQTTVSFVVNNAETAASIPLETKQRIENAIAELSYRPNPTAKALRTNSSRLLGFISDKIATTPFAGHTIKGAQDAAWEKKHLLMLVNTDGHEDIEREALEHLIDRQVDGIIYAAMYTREVKGLPESLCSVPSILVNCFSKELNLPYLIPDEHYGAKLATQHLLSKGHTRIAFINGAKDYYATEVRLGGYQEALREVGLDIQPEIVLNGNWWPNSGYEHALTLLGRKPRPSAIFCGNDRMALGALQAVTKLGLSVPTDVALIGYDGELITKQVVPPLTTVTLPHFEMGKTAVEFLTGVSKKPLESKIKGRLIEREST
jgi:LacI family transcriptional regulator